jgi:rubredoxin
VGTHPTDDKGEPETMTTKKWKCACGYIHDGDDAPERCPKCGAPAERFTLLDDATAERVERSRHSNALLCRMVDLARQIERACKDGIEDSLDPGCAKVFETALAHSYEIMKLSMTEVQGHVAKGKWG